MVVLRADRRDDSIGARLDVVGVVGSVTGLVGLEDMESIVRLLMDE